MKMDIFYILEENKWIAQTYNQIVSFIWRIADDCLRDVYVSGKYSDVILPMTVIRSLDAVLEQQRMTFFRNEKERLDAAMESTNQQALYVTLLVEAFCNSFTIYTKGFEIKSKATAIKG